MKRKLRIAMVAGEVSGDLLGADMIHAFSKNNIEAEFYGIGGPRMIDCGFRSMYDMERLSVMGLVEVLGRLRELIGVRKKIARELINNPPDVFIGIDAPDFNTDLELKLRENGITTFHYVSPTIWAWRSYRINKIKRAVNHMLVVFPFEMEFYKKHDIKATFVGHPAANDAPEIINKKELRKTLAIPEKGKLVAVLPGSRNSEIARLSDLYVKTMSDIFSKAPDTIFAIPFVNKEYQERFDKILSDHNCNHIPVFSFVGKSREVLAAADIALLASGTAALEAAVMRTPMVVTYRMNPVSMWLIRKFAHVKLYSMPNNLAGYELVPELIQERATVENLSREICKLLGDEQKRNAVSKELEKIYHQLRCDSGDVAMRAILKEIGYEKNNQA